MGEVPVDQPKLINLAFKVPSVGGIEEQLEGVSGWSTTAIHELDNSHFLEASFGGVRVNFFESAIYDSEARKTSEGFLHASFAVPSLEPFLARSEWKNAMIWGPETIRGGFGHRRIAFFELFPGCRIELMEELDD